MRSIFVLIIFLGLLCLAGAAVPLVSAQSISLGWIAYVQDGDIWTKELPDGTPQRLTHDGKNHRPRISPSGQYIAFVSSARCDSPSRGCIPTQEERNVWVMERSGEQPKQIAGCALEWAPTVDALTCTEPDGALSIVQAPDFVRRVIVQVPLTGEKVSLGGGIWNWDGKDLAYTRHDVLKEGTPSELRISLWRVNLEKGAAQELLNLGEPSQDGLLLYTWTPDQRALLYFPIPYFSNSIAADGLALYRTPVEGGAPTQLIDATIESPTFANLSAQHDSLVITAGSYRGSWTNKRIRVVNLRDGSTRDLTDRRVAAISPAWSPDGTRIAYVSMPDKGDLVGGKDARLGLRKRRIWLMNADGSNKKSLTRDEAYRDEYPQWSSGGGQILFARVYQPDLQSDASDRAELWVMRADGSEMRKIMDLGDATAGDPNVPLWFGYYGSIGWDQFYDWWQPPRSHSLPNAGFVPSSLVPIIALGALLSITGSILFVGTQAKNP